MKCRRIIAFIVLAILIIVLYILFKDKCITYTLSLCQILALILAVFVGVFISLNFSPVIALRIIPTWADKTNGILLIKTEVENISKVIAIVKKEGIRFQMLKQRTDLGDINEWVAFNKDDEKDMIPKPIDWKESKVINTSTNHLYPGDIVKAERIYKVDIKPNEVLHLGLQFKLAKGPLSLFHLEQWTTTCFFIPE